MNKYFLTFILIAVVATSFMSCERTTIDSDTHTQKFTIGSDTYDIKNAFTIESIKDSGMVYNAIILSQSEEVGSLGSRTKGAVIVFRGDITPGSYNLFYDPQEPSAYFPMYLVTELNMDNVINFSLENLMNQSEVYVADKGVFTLGINQDKFTVTTTNIEVKNVNDQTQVKTSSADYEGSMLRYVLSTVEEGDFNGISGSPTLHYVGTMPKFDFPFPEE